MAVALVKFREKGDARFLFLTPRGGGTGRRIHAARFEDKDGQTGAERAGQFVSSHAPGNPGIEWKVTK